VHVGTELVYRLDDKSGWNPLLRIYRKLTRPATVVRPRRVGAQGS
jgi:hypothetical protein